MSIRLTYGYDRDEDIAESDEGSWRSDAGVSGYGDVQITHGYTPYGFWFAEPPAPGRVEGDDYAQAPYFIPLSVDVQTDPVALKALSLGISYEKAKGVDAAMAQTINDTNSRVAMFGARLVEAMAKSSRDDLRYIANNWLQTASVFQDVGQKIMDGETPASRFPEWQALGGRLQTTADQLASEFALPKLTLMKALSPEGFNKATGFLKFLMWGGIAIAGLYFGSQVLGVVKVVKSRRKA